MMYRSFLDTSALAKRYVAETSSARLVALCVSADRRQLFAAGKSGLRVLDVS